MRPKRWVSINLACSGCASPCKGVFYPEVFSCAKNTPSSHPKPDEQEYIHDKYMNEMVNGNFPGGDA